MKCQIFNICLLIFALIFLIQVIGKGQDTLNVIEDGCTNLTPVNTNYDSSSYSLVGQDSLEITNISFQQMCFLPLVTQQWANDTLKISIKDTALTICLADCYQKIRFRIPFLIDTLNLEVGSNFVQLIKSDFVDVHKIRSSIEGMTIFPNPVENFCFLKFKEKNSFSLRLFNQQGNIILVKKFNNVNMVDLDMRHFASGVYNLVIQNNNSIQNVKLIKK